MKIENAIGKAVMVLAFLIGLAVIASVLNHPIQSAAALDGSAANGRR